VAFLLFFVAQNHSDGNIKINILNTTCIQASQPNDLLFEVENMTDKDFYAEKSSFLYYLFLLDSNGNNIPPARRINEEGDSSMILLKKQQKTRFTISFNFFDRFSLNTAAKYTLLLTYYNPQKRLKGKNLLTGKYEISPLDLIVCN
jgi:hypothetical protein